MELEITNTNNTNLNTEVDDFIKELKEGADKKEITIDDIKIDENSTLSLTNNDLKLGKGYEGIYSGYQIYHYQKLGKEAGLPPTMLENFFKDDIKQIYEQNATKLSESETIYTVFPDESKLYMFSNGKMEEAESFNGLTSKWFGEDGRIFKLDKSGELKEDIQSSKTFRDGILEDMKSILKPKYDKICKDYKKTNHIYEVDKAWDENYIPTITLKDISENRYLELEDLDFIENRYSGEGKYVVKDGEYYKINKAEEIPKNNTVDKEKEDEKNLSNIMAKKYDISKETIEELMKDFMTEASKDEGVVVYTGYDMEKDEYYRDYYMEGKFDERETISKEVADNMEVGTFLVMGRDELNNYYGFLSAYELEEEFEETIKLSLK